MAIPGRCKWKATIYCVSVITNDATYCYAGILIGFAQFDVKIMNKSGSVRVLTRTAATARTVIVHTAVVAAQAGTSSSPAER